MSKARIALVYDAIYPFIKGGAERRFYELGTRMAAMDYDVHWYGMKFWDGPNTMQHDGITLHGLCKARPLYTTTGRRSISQAVIFGVSCIKLLGARFDVIDCCGFPYFSLFPAKLAAVLHHKPLFATWHEVWGKKYWQEYLGKHGFIGYWVERIAAHLPNHIISISAHTSALLAEHCHINETTIVPNGIDLQAIKSVVPASQMSDLIYAGRLIDFKNIDLLIKALAVLKKQGTQLRCTIVGDGPAKDELHALAITLKVDKQISWLGFLEKSQDVYAHMKASKVFVLPSKREGFGIAAIEANACGIPVLTANYPGNAAKDLIVSEINGYLFEPTAEDLAIKITATMQNLKKLQKGSLHFAKQYDWESIVTDQLHAYLF